MTPTPPLRDAAQAALDALESLQGGCTDSEDGTVEAITVWCPEVIDNLRAALAAQPAPEAGPVATIRTWMKKGDRHAELWDWGEGLAALPEGEHKLYAAPVAPLMFNGLTEAETAQSASVAGLRATVAQQGAEPHPLDLLQAGFNNAELRAHWDKKLPGVEPTDRELSAFAVGTEVGFARARDLERQDWSRVWHALARAGLHPGRTDDRAEAVIDRLVAERNAALAAAHAQQPAALTDARIDEVRRVADALQAGADYNSSMTEYSYADHYRAAELLREFAGITATQAPTTDTAKD